MLLYNITFHVSHKAVDAFKKHLNEYHLPELDKHPDIEEYKLFRLLQQDETDGLTFTLQYFLKDTGTYKRHISVMDVSFKNELRSKFGDHVLYFCTLMESI